MDGNTGRPCRLCRGDTDVGDPGALCVRCARDALRVGRCPVPDGFYDAPTLRSALAAYNFSPVFRAVRGHAGLDQEALGLLIGMGQPRVSDIERGNRPLRDVGAVARVAAALGIPGEMLGFPSSPTGILRRQEVTWVDRRNFLSVVASAALGIGVQPELDRLETLLPLHSDPPPPQRIGVADVAAIEQATAAFRSASYRHGGGMSCAAAYAQLRHVLKLEDADCTDQVRADLQLATADLAAVAAWMAYDVEQHDTARRLWLVALDTARRVQHPRGADLTVVLLLDLAHQALHLHRPDDALRLTQLSTATATTGKYPISASSRSYVAAIRAWCHAAMDAAEPCLRALDETQRIHADADPNNAPPWATHVTRSEIAAQHGHSFSLLAETDPTYAPTAIQHLSAALEGFGPAYSRSRAINLPGLARSHFHAGDVTSAVTIGEQAVSEISALSSTRTHARLRALDKAAAPYDHDSGVADLRQRIRHTVAMTT